MQRKRKFKRRNVNYDMLDIKNKLEDGLSVSDIARLYDVTSQSLKTGIEKKGYNVVKTLSAKEKNL